MLKLALTYWTLWWGHIEGGEKSLALIAKIEVMNESNLGWSPLSYWGDMVQGNTGLVQCGRGYQCMYGMMMTHNFVLVRTWMGLMTSVMGLD